MNVDFDYISTKHYNRTNIRYWLFYFYRFTGIKGFILRIFGFDIKVTEKDATEKLIKKFRLSERK